MGTSRDSPNEAFDIPCGSYRFEPEFPSRHFLKSDLFARFDSEVLQKSFLKVTCPLEVTVNVAIVASNRCPAHDSKVELHYR